MKQILSIITALILIYGLFEIKSTMKDKKTIKVLDKAFNKNNQSQTNNLERKATFQIKKKSTK